MNEAYVKFGHQQFSVPVYGTVYISVGTHLICFSIIPPPPPPPPPHLDSSDKCIPLRSVTYCA